MKKIIISLPAIAIVAACGAPSTPVSTGPVKALPDFVFEEAFASVVADSIAEECSTIRYNRRHENLMTEVIGDQLVEQGYTERDVDVGFAQLDEAKVQRDFFNYIEANNIVINNANTWCKAGVAEIGKDSRIGRYLMVR